MLEQINLQAPCFVYLAACAYALSREARRSSLLVDMLLQLKRMFSVLEYS